MDNGSRRPHLQTITTPVMLPPLLLLLRNTKKTWQRQQRRRRQLKQHRLTQGWSPWCSLFLSPCARILEQQDNSLKYICRTTGKRDRAIFCASNSVLFCDIFVKFCDEARRRGRRTKCCNLLPCCWCCQCSPLVKVIFTCSKKCTNMAQLADRSLAIPEDPGFNFH